ncbi:hypothetical protein GOV08_03710 [Candidatus Woesearchaeota archaeon]|nr:hypothetical protein [Candidatus Woesearchaeota archaeon]
MGIFDVFKKKEEAPTGLKDPLTDPMAALPGEGQGPVGPPLGDLPPPDMPGMPSMNDSGLDMPQSGVDPSNQSTSASPLPALPPLDDSGFGREEPPQASTPKSFETTEESHSFDKRDMELINSKLDNIKSMLENLSQRVANIEKQEIHEEGPRPKRFVW